jgi:hypothetical protein
MSKPVPLQFSQAEIGRLIDATCDQKTLLEQQIAQFTDVNTGEVLHFFGEDIHAHVAGKRRQLAECLALRQRLISVWELPLSTNNTHKETAA